MDRMLSKAPVLDNHYGDQVGVIERCWLDENERKLRAVMRFSKGIRGTEIWQDIKDGIRANVSIGYIVREMVLLEEKDGVSTYMATKWEPYEASIVNVPADHTVGVGRAKDEEVKIIQIKQGKGSAMDEERKEQVRVEELREIGKQFNLDPEWAVRQNLTVDQYRAFVLNEVGKQKQAPVATAPETEIGMSKKEQGQYSILRAINAMVTGNWKHAGLEREASEAVEKALGKAARGIYVPYDIQKRDLSVGGATTGAKLVGTEHQGQNFIDYLYAKMLATKLGVQRLTGLSQNVSIPKMTGTGTAYWVDEAGDVTESTQTIGQLLLSPKTVAAVTEFTRLLMLQGNPAVERLVMNDLSKVLALAIDSAIFQGTGADGQPKGIIGTTGVDDVTGTSFSYAKAIEMQTAVETANADADSMFYVTNPTVRGALKVRAKETGHPVYLCGENNIMAGYPVMASSQIAENTMVYGDFSQAIWAEFGVLDLLVNQYQGNNGNVKIFAFQSVDVGVRQPGAFSKTQDFS